jgi:hypothetical protein
MSRLLHDLEVPPIARCTICAAFDCDGIHAVVAPVAELAWEGDSGSWTGRLLCTARQSVTADASDCLDVNPPRVGRALAFALLAEVGAIGSLALLGAGMVVLVFPQGMSTLLCEGILASALALLVAFMVIVHLSWGFGLELAVRWRGARPDLARSLTFALYACGWDLLTSPLGALLVLLGVGRNAGAGRSAGVSEIRAAMRVPLAATVHYVVRARGVSHAQAPFIGRASFALPALLTLAAAAWVVALVVTSTLGLRY